MVIDYKGLDRIRRVSKKGPLILVPCHKSHLDYLIISWVFLNNKIPCPLIAAGKNLSFWPLGPIFRGGGAFFLRRTFKGEVLYTKIFAAYIKKILTEGFHIEFFIEGGRSRTGKLLTPKIGFLSLLIDAFIENNWDDMTFVPIYIGYDRVLEEKAYIHEMEGGKKSPENLKNVIKARKFLKKKYGKIYLNFHKPFSLKNYLENFNQSPAQNMLSESQQNMYHQFGLNFLHPPHPIRYLKSVSQSGPALNIIKTTESFSLFRRHSLPLQFSRQMLSSSRPLISMPAINSCTNFSKMNLSLTRTSRLNIWFEKT